MPNLNGSGANCEQIATADPIYIETGEHDLVQRGPVIGKDGKYNMPVDVDTANYICPCCNRAWPEAPDIFISRDQSAVWVEGKFIGVRRKLTLSFWETITERFGAFMSREEWVEVACSDIPDCDMPDNGAFQNIVGLIREGLTNTNVELQLYPRLGYRLTTKDNAAAFIKRTKERAETERVKHTQNQIEHRINIERVRRSKRAAQSAQRKLNYRAHVRRKKANERKD